MTEGLTPSHGVNIGGKDVHPLLQLFLETFQPHSHQTAGDLLDRRHADLP